MKTYILKDDLNMQRVILKSFDVFFFFFKFTQTRINPRTEFFDGKITISFGNKKKVSH